MKYGPVFLLSPGRSGSTFAQRLMNSVGGWYLFGEHGGAFSRFLDFQRSLEYNSENQKKFGDMIIDRPEGFLDHFSAWASPFDLSNAKATFVRTMQELYTKRLPERCLWGFKEIRYAGSDSIMFGEAFPDSRIVVLQRDFEDYCRSWCVANMQGHELSVTRARQLVFSYLDFYEELRIASAISDRPFLFVSYEQICAAPQDFIDLVAAEFAWTVTDEDRSNVDSTSRRKVDYISDGAKIDGQTKFADFVKLATDLYSAADRRPSIDYPITSLQSPMRNSAA